MTWTYFILLFCVNCELRHLYKLSGHTIVWRNISSQQTVSIIESNILFFSERAVPLHLFPFLSTIFFFFKFSLTFPSCAAILTFTGRHFTKYSEVRIFVCKPLITSASEVSV